jgi:DNA oxidative demethylase
MNQADLFGQSASRTLLPGLDYREGFIDREEECAIIDKLLAVKLAPFRFHGWTGNRKTQSYGWRYDFDDASFQPTEPIPRWLEPLREKCAGLAGVSVDEFVQALVARYDPGAGIGWHKDRSVFERVVGVSLNASANLRFRQRAGVHFRRFSLLAEPRSAYLLSGEARHEWEHSIAPGEALRFSITFRTLSDFGRRKAAEAQRSS